MRERRYAHSNNHNSKEKVLIVIREVISVKYLLHIFSVLGAIISNGNTVVKMTDTVSSRGAVLAQPAQ